MMQIPTPTYPIPPFAPDYSGVRAQKIPNPKYPIPPFAPYYYFEAGDQRTPNYPIPPGAPDYSGGGCRQEGDCCVCGSCTRTECHVLCIASGRRPAACSSRCCCCSPGGSAAAWWLSHGHWLQKHIATNHISKSLIFSRSKAQVKPRARDPSTLNKDDLSVE